jgi:hypothetical protein
MKVIGFDGMANGVGMNVPWLRKGADFPVLGVEIRADLGAGFGTDHVDVSSETWNAWERVNPIAAPAAEDAAEKRRRKLFRPELPIGKSPSGLLRCRCGPTSPWCRREDRKGTLIRQACSRAAAVIALPVVLIQPPFGTLLVAAIGTTPLLEPRRRATARAAIALAAITMPTDPEHRVASAAAGSLT